MMPTLLIKKIKNRYINWLLNSLFNRLPKKIENILVHLSLRYYLIPEAKYLFLTFWVLFIPISNSIWSYNHSFSEILLLYIVNFSL